MTSPTDLCGALKGARERLCVVQTHTMKARHRRDLQAALDTIDRLGIWYCSQWSKYDDPTFAGGK